MFSIIRFIEGFKKWKGRDEDDGEDVVVEGEDVVVDIYGEDVYVDGDDDYEVIRGGVLYFSYSI